MEDVTLTPQIARTAALSINRRGKKRFCWTVLYNLLRSVKASIRGGFLVCLWYINPHRHIPQFHRRASISFPLASQRCFN